ncbi:trans-sulfuration enzyme family protein [Flexithrix dorotheae]|uniref:trans-sulfuration enzyme family protein n=1 Tax=Flexithrix dorotheae TaxID=70993 RepID=UPI00036C0B42|nr:PLP-dependent aspartate aminotransferase family protein [Flexithrix dorotheae]
MEKTFSKETNCIHTQQDYELFIQGVNTPIDPSSAFQYRGFEENVYPRYYNTINQKVVVEKLTALEKGETGLLFSSGMAAISSILFSFLKTGDHAIFYQKIYGGTFSFIKTEFEKFGIEYSFVEEKAPEAFEKAIKSNTKIVYIESPTNPLLDILDIKSIAEVSKKHQLISIIDNTFATPINQTPIALGIDISLHSGTKYLGGHSDLAFGAVVTSKELNNKILKSAINQGGSLNALDVYLIERSLKTLDVRVNRQNENALQIAEFLEKHHKVGRVYYPGLKNHPGYEIAREQMKGFGGMLSFELKADGIDQVNHFLDALNLIKPALSLGGVETIICSPALTSHIKMSKADREKAGISDGLLRLSVGIENVQDLQMELDFALNKT